jgi:hypothetical protein
VFTHGDGTFDRDTIVHGRFWHREDAEIFKRGLEAEIRKDMGDREWLEYAHKRIEHLYGESRKKSPEERRALLEEVRVKPDSRQCLESHVEEHGQYFCILNEDH